MNLGAEGQRGFKQRPLVANATPIQESVLPGYPVRAGIPQRTRRCTEKTITILSLCNSVLSVVTPDFNLRLVASVLSGLLPVPTVSDLPAGPCPVESTDVAMTRDVSQNSRSFLLQTLLPPRSIPVVAFLV